MDMPLLDISYEWNDTIMWSPVSAFFQLSSRYQGPFMLGHVLALPFYG